MTDFVHLHVHTEYSLLDGACRIDPLMARCAELQQTAVAITDHGAMFGVYDFYTAARKHGIHPIIGCEVYVAPRSRQDRDSALDLHSAAHLVLLCENMTGYRNLIKMVSLGYIDGFYNKPRIDKALLAAHSEGLICLSACLAGELPQLLAAGDTEGAKNAALWYRDIFGADNYFLELQDHGIPEQRSINRALVRLAEETGIPLVATNDAHYLTRSDAETQDVLLCIQTNKTVDAEDRLRFESDEFYIKSGDEMQALFPDQTEALANTVRIAARCAVDFSFGGYVLPAFPLPSDAGTDDHAVFFRRLCETKFLERYGADAPEGHRARLEYEIRVITEMGYIDYYLIVWDFIRYARENGIPVGPGRGSGAGSIAAYCLEITNICPIQYDLYFERFLNPERISMPDFDIDFCPKRRGEVIRYMSERYGADHVAQIVTFGTMAARSAIRDVARALGYPLPQTDVLAKMIPNELMMTIDKALETGAELRTLYESDEAVRRVIDIARRIEGMPRNTSTHAAGVVLTPRPVYEYVPLAVNDNVVVTQFSMNNVGAIGLVKMDFLGLRNLTVIRDAELAIRTRVPDFNIERIPHDDAETFAMLAEGKTCGVFQIESAGMTEVAVGMQAQSIEELSAVIALYRPGPMDSIPRFIRGKKQPETVRYRHPLLHDILDVTYGCPLYQEQVMMIFRKLAGFSMGRADIVRSAISKKRTEIIEAEKQNFIYGNPALSIPGCIQNGVPERDALALFDEILDFGGYAFNKAHSAAYALVSYQTAYLKRHYPQEYMGALLSSELGNTHKVVRYISECKALGIRVLPPDVNRSGRFFAADGEDIRFGLSAIKNVSDKIVTHIVAEREENGVYAGFADFCRRISNYELNSKTTEWLIRAGACDTFGLSRDQMLMTYEHIIEDEVKERSRIADGQISLFGELPEVRQEPIFPVVAETSPRERFAMEKEATGIYLTGHPLDAFAKVFQHAQCTELADIFGEQDNGEDKDEGDGLLRGNEAYMNRSIQIGGIVTAVRRKTTKNGETMAILTVEDMTASIEMLVFPKIWTQYGGLLNQDNVVLIRGRVSLRENEDPKLICEAVTPAGQSQPPEPQPESQPESQPMTVYLRVYDEEEQFAARLRGLFQMFPGDRDVVIKYPVSGRTFKTKPGQRVSGDRQLYAELERLIGKENVIIQ